MAALNYHHLRYFWTVAREGNLTQAAQHLNVSQSALSIQIKNLEGRLGHKLFERRNRQLRLTEAGRITLDYANSIFATGDELIHTLKGVERPRQTIRIGALATLSRNFLIGFLRPILKRTDVNVILRSGTTAELLRDLDTLGHDVVLLNQPRVRDAASTVISHRISEQRVSLVGTPARVGKRPKLAELLTQHPIILPTADSGIRMGFDALVDRMGITPHIVAEVDDMAMMRLLAREGTGLAVLPPIVVKDELTNGVLREASRLPGIAETFYAVTRERNFPNPLVKVLLHGSVRN
ncbi:MAG: LysR family transcriptional regulator [Proteobacteria bacterium]|nr:LysR family transcriptional regulator [Pseudomonadota bacterium]